MEWPESDPPRDLILTPGAPRDLRIVVIAWLALAIALGGLASRNLSVPGLFYDEAIFAGMAKDFVTGQTHGQHLAGSQVINLFGRPFPLFIQDYLGALKCWLVVPSFGLFGSSVPVLRLTSLAWSLAGLLVFMLWTCRWLGLGAALLAGALLALDPTFYFLSLLDWGSVVPSFACRVGGFYLTWLWWQRRRTLHAVLAGAFFGLGLFNKFDFIVVLGGVGFAALCCYGRPLWACLRERPIVPVLASLAFLLAAGPTILKLPEILTGSPLGTTPGAGGEWAEKTGTLRAMYDGSYFYRLMGVGGLFQNMFQRAPYIWEPFGLAFLSAAVLLVVWLVWARWPKPFRQVTSFLVLSTASVTLGVLLLPGAVRMHHSVLVYPFPHMLVAIAVMLLQRRLARPGSVTTGARILLSLAAAVLLLGELLAIHKTQRLIRQTGGQGWWSEGLNTFCSQVKSRSDLTIVSLDWGFNEQLLFLTQGPTLKEPFWTGQRDLLPGTPGTMNCVYLVHPLEYRLINLDHDYLDPAFLAAYHLQCQPYTDRTNGVAFYVIRPQASRF